MANMSRFEKAFDKVNKRIEEVLEASARRAEGEISSIERARINVTLAKALNVVYAMHLEVQGVSADDHPVRGELRRMERSLEMVEERLRIGRGTRTSEDAAVGVSAKALDESGTKSGKGRKRKKTRPEGV